MKKILFSVILFVTFTAHAQVKYGLKAGVNFANAEIKSSGITLSPGSLTSFHVTGFADIALSDKFSFQPGLSFQGKGYRYDVNEDGVRIEQTTNVAYLEIPLNAVLYLPVGQGNVFLGAGPYVAYGLFGESKYESNVPELGSGKDDIKFGNGADDDASPLDLGLNFMIGYKLNSGLLFNAGYGLGLANTVPKDLRENDIKSTNRVFSVSVGYSF